MHLTSVFGGGEQVAARPEVGRDTAERGQEPLCSARGAEVTHGSFLLSGGLMRVLGPVVQILRAAVLSARCPVVESWLRLTRGPLFAGFSFRRNESRMVSIPGEAISSARMINAQT